MRLRHLTSMGSLALAMSVGAVTAQEMPRHALPLQLEAIINDKPTGFIIPATLRADGSLVIERGELAEIGIKVPGSGSTSQLIDLRQAGFTHSYDEARQRILFVLSDEQRLPRVIDARGNLATQPQVTSGWGALLNYAAFTSSSTMMNEWRLTPAVANLRHSAQSRH